RLLDVLGLTAQLVLFWTPTLWRWPLFDQAPGPLTEILSAAGGAPFPGFAAVQAFFTQMFGLAALSVLLWGWLVFMWLFNRRKIGASPLNEHESG
ncbi:MAG TPA: hypothetical protein VLS48_03205, partial [Anaerolineales bacterium]|nr:hypothetical protein [Anaerolineales bacterium]